MKIRLDKHNRGFSLIELLVAMAIGMVVTIAITSVMISFDRSKRTSTAQSDAGQTSTYVGYVLDRTIRNAGGGFAKRAADVFGCNVNANYNGVAVLPRAAAFPAPFDNLAGTALSRRLIPVLIEQGAANTGTEVRGDVITVMAGTSGVGELPQRVTAASVTANNLRLPNTLGWRGGDLVLLADRSVTGGCIVEQVSASFAGGSSQFLTLNTATTGGVYYAATGSTVNLTSFAPGNGTYAIQLGNPSLLNPPQFTMFAVGNNATLHTFDLLSNASTTEQMAEGIVEMRAAYGIDTNGDRVLDAWQNPGASPYNATSLTDGSVAATNALRSIVAVRIALVVRSSLREKDPINAVSALTMFGDLPSAVRRTRSLSSEEQHFRHRVIEVTVPLQNMLI